MDTFTWKDGMRWGLMCFVSVLCLCRAAFVTTKKPRQGVWEMGTKTHHHLSGDDPGI